MLSELVDGEKTARSGLALSTDQTVYLFFSLYFITGIEFPDIPFIFQLLPFLMSHILSQLVCQNRLITILLHLSAYGRDISIACSKKIYPFYN